MIFNKKKFHILTGLTVFLIAIIVGFSAFGLTMIEAGDVSQVEGSTAETPEEKDEFEIETDTEVPEEDDSEMNKLTNLFTNAWTAFNYALEMEKQHSHYFSYTNTMHGDVANLPVTVDVKINRHIYNDISEIYVVNTPKTVIDFGNLGIDAQLGENYTSYTMFDIANDTLTQGGALENLTQHKKDVLLTTYDFPYVVNKNTAEVLGGIKNNPDLPYYEIKMRLKPEAWKTYALTLQKVLGIDNVPVISGVTLNIKINKTYGTFYSIEADESFSCIYKYGEISAKINATGTTIIKYNYTADMSSNIQKIREMIGIA